MRILFALSFSIAIWLCSSETSASTIDLHLKEGEFALSFLPLSDGEAAIIHTANGRHYLINTGTKDSRSSILAYLRKFKMDRLSGLILTDQQEGASDFIHKLNKFYQLKRVYSVHGKDELSKSKLYYEGWKAGDVKELAPGIRLTVLYSGRSAREGMDFSIKHHDSRFLWMSSASKKSERSLLKEELKDINIVKVPGHGGSSSLSYNLLTHMDPQTAVIFKQKGKKPEDDFLELLHQLWIDVFYTDQHGLITIKFTQLGYEVLTFSE
ncbi:ComEC/Rec2 family competence protein [Bacillus xiapuensis]|uniref:ComEC/Rec2 family competence protein n=1 Tax=Bacillus xiapuensis TaxID=2014075 RepID=UPI000C244FFC|nr:hypothetical protein [Bacillus xiapuensis]